jgi:hypothetical protein
MILELDDARNATLARNAGIGTILDDDRRRLPAISIGNATKVEGTTPQESETVFTAPMSFTVTLSFASTTTVRVRYTTGDGTAIGGLRSDRDDDFVRTAGVLTFPPGTTSRTIDVPVFEDRTMEDDETFSVLLLDPVNAALGDDEGGGTIVDDDPRPTVSFLGEPPPAFERRAGHRIRLDVVLSNPTEETVTVRVSTQDGAATSPGDYQAMSAALLFAPGQRFKSVDVVVNDDEVVEGIEHFSVILTDAQNATIVGPDARVEIHDNDYDADVNGDGVVDAIDLRLVRDAFPSELGDPDYRTEADVDRDGRVDSNDLRIVARAIRESRR